jgi:hypothetical protein
MLAALTVLAPVTAAAPTGLQATLPEQAEPIDNSIPGPDGETSASRGYVFAHPAGVIGFEVVEAFATASE